MTLSNENKPFTQNDIDEKGSKLRCLLLTGLGKNNFRNILTKLINQKNPNSINFQIPDEFEYYPKGLLDRKEIQLDKKEIHINGYLGCDKILNKWWLKTPQATTPNWDILCTANIDGKPGFILVEAKAHYDELKENDSTDAGSNSPNLKKIMQAMEEINDAYGYSLSWEHNYQMSNRVAWSLKLASEGFPVILIYLGFLNAKEIDTTNNSYIFNKPKQWRKIVQEHSQAISFSDWEKQISAKKNSSVQTNFYPIIRSMDIQLTIEY